MYDLPRQRRKRQYTGRKESAVRRFALTGSAEKPDAELSESISEGKGNMPAFKTLLSADEIHSVLVYVRTLAPKSDPSAKKEIRQVIRSVPRKTPAAQVRVWHGPLAAPYLT